jgi:hypothetical protein
MLTPRCSQAIVKPAAVAINPSECVFSEFSSRTPAKVLSSESIQYSKKSSLKPFWASKLARPFFFILNEANTDSSTPTAAKSSTTSTV